MSSNPAPCYGALVPPDLLRSVSQYYLMVRYLWLLCFKFQFFVVVICFYNPPPQSTPFLAEEYWTMSTVPHDWLLYCHYIVLSAGALSLTRLSGQWIWGGSQEARYVCVIFFIFLFPRATFCWRQRQTTGVSMAKISSRLTVPSRITRCWCQKPTGLPYCRRPRWIYSTVIMA